MSDEEYRECIGKLIEGGRQWEALRELQEWAIRHISRTDFAIREAEAERRTITKICNSDLSTIAKVLTIKEFLESEQEHE